MYHLMVHNGTSNVAKSSQKFICTNCDYSTCKLYNWKKHLDTKKHKNGEMVHNGTQKVAKSSSPDSPRIWICNCGKSYKHSSGYYRHIKTCTKQETVTESPISTGLSKDDVIDILKAIMPTMTEVAANNNAVICNGSNNTINNQEVNINLYLNEKCGDAMSIQGFTQQLSLTVADLLKNGKPIARDGVSNIFIDNLRPLALEERPIHCVDAAKRSWHVKDDVVGWTSGEVAASGALTAANFHVSKSLGKLWDASYPGWEKDGERTEQFHTLCQMLMDDPTSSEIEKALESIGPECKLCVEDLEKLAIRPKKE